ncbi:MAG: HAMP domain-containing protein [Burkholderiales bacterium]|nr:HAMP domain-containing protein [Burkholderiales bacterium]
MRLRGLLRPLDPRRHLAAAIGWLVFAIVALAALAAATLAAREAEDRALADTQRLLAQFATQTRQALDTALATRRDVVQAAATMIALTDDRDAGSLRRRLQAVQAQFPELVWLGLADARGRLLAGTAESATQTATKAADRPADEPADEQPGAEVAARAWFRAGLRRPVLEDAQAGPGAGPRFAEIAAPVVARAGAPVQGVLGARLSWAWLDAQVAGLRQALDTRRRLDLLLVARDGRVLVGPPGWAGRRLGPADDLGEGGRRLVGRSASAASSPDMLGWSVVVRQDRASALAAAHRVRREVFGLVGLAGLAAAAAAVAAAWWLTRRLARLAAEAQAVRLGQRRTLAAPEGRDEVARIGATLAALVEHLQAEKQALATLNAELDARVAERTARIERLADESRHAAVTRERLRLARALHDTLAHSLMALLTQIRLVRKLRLRLDGAALDEELGRAEAVATSGLAEARAAIAQMRHSGVRDDGLGPALQALLARFRERTGLAATLQADAASAALADARAETVLRIVEEALHNVERHAQARAVQVVLATQPGAPGGAARVSVEVVDDGVGFDPAPARPGHYGLVGMREQAALIGAQLSLTRRDGGGTRLALAFEA